jgi:hypothetical protein
MLNSRERRRSRGLEALEPLREIILNREIPDVRTTGEGQHAGFSMQFVAFFSDLSLSFATLTMPSNPHR